MPLFYYTVRDINNNKITGRKNSDNKETLIKELKEDKFSIISVYETPKKSIWQWSTISDRNILLFTRYFASLLKAGISAYKSINILQKQEKNHSLKEILGVISHDIENGSTLYEAFLRFKNVFGTVYLGLLRTGEESGRLHDLLEKCANLIENKIIMRRKVISIISYPVIIISLILILVFVIFMQIVPKFQTLYSQMGLTLDDLPLITKTVIGIADFVRTNIFYEIGAILILTGLFFQIYTTVKGKYIIDKSLIKMPLIKDLVIKYYISRFSRNLSILFESGFSVMIAFDRSEQIITNMAVKKNMEEVKFHLEKGNSLTDSFAKVNMIPEISLEMISIGEQTASFDKMLVNIAEFYEKDLDYVTETFMNWIEPSIIIILGLVVGTILLSVYLPVFSLASKMKLNV